MYGAVVLSIGSIDQKAKDAYCLHRKNVNSRYFLLKKNVKPNSFVTITNLQR